MEKQISPEKLVDRLIEDIKKSIQICEQTHTIDLQMSKMVTASIRDVISTLNADNLNTHVDILAQLLGANLIQHNHGDKLDINQFLRDLMNNKINITERIQCILDSNLTSVNNEPVAKMLRQQLDWIHRNAR